MNPCQRIDVVITATLRPEVLDLTLHSFSRNLLRQPDKVRVILNVDPIGDMTRSQDEVVRTCKRYFPIVIARTPPEPSFSKAVKWCWEQVQTDMFLHLEDDWLLKRPIDLDQIVAAFEQDRNIASVRLNRDSNPARDPVWSPYFSLNPSFIRKEFVTEALPFFLTTCDPEKQFCELDGEKKRMLGHWKYLCYGVPNEPPLVIDIGRSWLQYNHYGKWKKGAAVIAWERRISTHHELYYRLRYQLLRAYWKHYVLRFPQHKVAKIGAQSMHIFTGDLARSSSHGSDLI